VLTKPGFETVSTELSVAADSGRTVELELAAQYGDVEIVSEPPAAEIWIDDERVGTTPATLRLTALPHAVEVRLEGYAPQSAEITPRPGLEHELPFELVELNELTGGGYKRTLVTSLDQELRLIPAGEFTMGTSRREVGRRSNEFLRPVRLSKAFYLGTREVSNAEFREFDAEHDSGVFGDESLDGDDQPVVNVSWPEVARFLNWLSIRDGLQPVYEERSDGWAPVRPLRNGYRLPTEAEWARAARFADLEQPRVFPWGDEIPPPDRSGNYADISASGILPTTLETYNDSFPVSAPVGSFEPNNLGLHDLGGNVAEWVQDFYTLEFNAAAEVAVDPLGPETGSYHMVRGSSWKSATLTDLRMAYRTYSSDGQEDLGFRIARDLD
jgi:formylglycine-generating enzyme required for sulfatase activity